LIRSSLLLSNFHWLLRDHLGRLEPLFGLNEVLLHLKRWLHHLLDNLRLFWLLNVIIHLAFGLLACSMTSLQSHRVISLWVLLVRLLSKCEFSRESVIKSSYCVTLTVLIGVILFVFWNLMIKLILNSWRAILMTLFYKNSLIFRLHSFMDALRQIMSPLLPIIVHIGVQTLIVRNHGHLRLHWDGIIERNLICEVLLTWNRAQDLLAYVNLLNLVLDLVQRVHIHRLVLRSVHRFRLAWTRSNIEHSSCVVESCSSVE